VTTSPHTIDELEGEPMATLEHPVAALVRGHSGVLEEGGHFVAPASAGDVLAAAPQPTLEGAVNVLPSWAAVLERVVWRDLAFGESRACGIDAAGTALCTGLAEARNDSQLTVIHSAPATRVDVGARSACVLDASGVVTCEEDVGLAIPRAVDIAVAEEHACAATVDGEVLCWGSALAGRLGDGRREYRRGRQPPTEAMVPRGARSVAAAGATTCAVISDRVWCWGHSAWGQAGPGDHPCGARASIAEHACQYVPYQVDLPDATVAVVVTSVTSCALLLTGEVWCWGVVPGTSYPEWPARVASQDCWIAPRLVLSGAAAIARSAGGRVCALNSGASRVACFGGGAPDSAGAWPQGDHGAVTNPFVAFDMQAR
jgi:hypothetical protein